MFEAALREQFVRIGQLMHARNYVTGVGGNISVRLDSDRFLVTPSGKSKGFMSPEQMVVVDWEGLPVENSSCQCSSEVSLHLEAYRQRPDIRAVIHAHPLTAIALSIAGISPARCLGPEVIVLLGWIPVTPYATASTREGAEVIRDLITRYDALVLQRHGSVTVGITLQDAYLKLETLEAAAEVTFKAMQLGQETPLPADALGKLIRAREDRGLMRPGQKQEILAAARRVGSTIQTSQDTLAGF
jgi:L-fuculose-phosphate aldolase